MNSSVKKYQISILGEHYSLISDEPEHTILGAAQLVDTYMQQVAQKSQINDVHRIAVLVAMKLASQLIAQQGEHEELSNTVVSQIDHIIRHLEHAGEYTPQQPI